MVPQFTSICLLAPLWRHFSVKLVWLAVKVSTPPVSPVAGSQVTSMCELAPREVLIALTGLNVNVVPDWVLLVVREIAYT